MFGIGMPELILIMAIALIVIGPKKLPDLARSLGRAMGEFKKATGELKSSLGVDEDLSEVKTAFDEMNKDIKDAVDVNPLNSVNNNTDTKSTVADTGPDPTENPSTSGTASAPKPDIGASTESTKNDDETIDPNDPDARNITVINKEEGDSVGDR